MARVPGPLQMGAGDYTSALHLRMTCSYRLSRRLRESGRGCPEGESSPPLRQASCSQKRYGSAWRNGTQQADHDSQQQKTTQKQRELAHRNLYSVMTERGWPLQGAEQLSLPSAPGLEVWAWGYCRSSADTVTDSVSRKKSRSDGNDGWQYPLCAHPPQPALTPGCSQVSRRSFASGTQPSSSLPATRHQSQPFNALSPSTCWPGSTSSSWAE